MDQIINPYILYGLCVLGALGVCLALPRRGISPQVIGALIAALAGGLGLVALGAKNPQALPNVYFYIFSLVALGAALRVITHPRPVYGALYFVLTVIATAGLFLILSAEFMAFALVIVYAGAILITYLFVIMLATQAPQEGEVEVLTEYDTAAREPVGAAVVGFLLLALLTTLMFKGLPELTKPGAQEPNALLTQMPRKVERSLRESGAITADMSLKTDAKGNAIIDFKANTVAVKDASGVEKQVQVPDRLKITNPDRLGFNLLRDHPGTIEIAGVILLMAMLGAVVLSRKQVQIDEEAKMHQSRSLAASLAKSKIDNRVSEGGGVS
ncbi:MAG: NADH-quinone oxidoreductase subunit J [Planctomycetota bacterium]|nr:NADH-quinone oxidoreductase subunit J [Planctomycetota bacterium]